MSNQPIQVMRIVDGREDGCLEEIGSFGQLTGYSFLEAECLVAQGTGFGQPILLMFRGPSDRVRIEILEYRSLKAQYSGTDPSVRKMIEGADTYLARIDGKLREEQDRMFKTN